ncbi:hypothetical protein Nepgr_016033 [Nepenthes gracilis]|uniref:Uncharacterized protein n=1 Tax=Nepenthes gracilis TaxID=150966 RepID=A0AAD3SPB6_NEPGR|nr:hypothetical protein Nepgr_016033 [Nepenthes gracilis]
MAGRKEVSVVFGSTNSNRRKVAVNSPVVEVLWMGVTVLIDSTVVVMVPVLVACCIADILEDDVGWEMTKNTYNKVFTMVFLTTTTIFTASVDPNIDTTTTTLPQPPSLSLSVATTTVITIVPTVVTITAFATAITTASIGDYDQHKY